MTPKSRTRTAGAGGRPGGTRWRRAGALAAVLALALSGTATATASASTPEEPRDRFAAYTGQKIEWGDCPFEATGGARTAECARITVPRDWSDPGAGADLKVAVSRVEATGERRGSLLVNPGGPGGQGSSLAGLLAGLRPELGERYDVIGMDPRGTGQLGAGPQDLMCSVPNAELPPEEAMLDARDRSRESIAEHLKIPRAIAKACSARELAPYVTTWQTAHDMDLIRGLLGERKLDYLGYSYGSWLGAKYASLFPHRAGRVVLDSSVNWQGRLQAAFEDFPRIGQRQLEQVYLPWVVRNFPVVGETPEEALETWEKVRAYYVSMEVPADSYDGIFVGMGNELQWILATAVLVAGAEELAGGGEEGGGSANGAAASASPELRKLLDERSRAEFGTPAAELTAKKVAASLTDPEPEPEPEPEDPEFTDIGGTRFAVACGDQPTRSPAWYRLLSEVQGPKYPMFGWAYGIGEPCAFWPDTARQKLPNLPRSVRGNVLVVQSEFDPQTGYEQAAGALRRAPGTGLVEVDDSTFHGQYILDGNACVDTLVDGFLLDGDRPDRATCAGLPLPGETEVYPVDGPVTGKPSGAQQRRTDDADPAAEALRRAAQEQVSEVNRFTP
ncbi:alpha/beta hydrolase [Streptomyces zingiberis]|uniref:Alpha/beta hydrolase n=1 Tax=Streptomyces zingiberis TaxID=2053010 RepID=A0ABX1C027_9ACTN|nr:alpha/beta hydrolase [Streptomyces zingiberis]NJQ03272.1 alpha/beta hydrolase [Streptomyces zingiberis]